MYFSRKLLAKIGWGVLRSDGKHRSICNLLWSVRSTADKCVSNSRPFWGKKHGPSFVMHSAARQRG